MPECNTHDELMLRPRLQLGRRLNEMSDRLGGQRNENGTRVLMNFARLFHGARERNGNGNRNENENENENEWQQTQSGHTNCQARQQTDELSLSSMTTTHQSSSSTRMIEEFYSDCLSAHQQKPASPCANDHHLAQATNNRARTTTNDNWQAAASGTGLLVRFRCKLGGATTGCELNHQVRLQLERAARSRSALRHWLVIGWGKVEPLWPIGQRGPAAEIRTQRAALCS